MLGFILFGDFAWGQNLNSSLQVKVEHVYSKSFPNIQTIVTVLDQNGQPITDLVSGNFRLLADEGLQHSPIKLFGFQYTNNPISYVVLMTNSGLMDGAPMEQEKKGVLTLLDRMRKQDTLSVYLISEQATPIFENVIKSKVNQALINKIQADPLNQPRLLDSLSNIVAKVTAAPSERKILILMSDGRDSQSRLSKDIVMRQLSEANFPMYSIGIKLLSTDGLDIIDQISHASGGSYFYAGVPSDISRDIKAITKEVLTSYVLKSKITTIIPDNERHQLGVVIKSNGQTGRGNRTFVAVKNPIPLWLQIVFLVIIIAVVIGLILVILIIRKKRRQKIGITKRRCPDCSMRMKDDWEFCPFCAYLSEKQLPRKKSSSKAKKA